MTQSDVTQDVTQAAPVANSAEGAPGLVAPRLDRRGRLVIRRTFYGGAYQLMFNRDVEVCLDGPAGTGKTVAALNKVYLALMKYPGARWLIARKTNVDLAASALVTFQTQVLQAGDGVTFRGASKVKPAAFIFPNGSEAIVTGLDKAGKVKSAEYDGAYINEATEIEIDHLEMIRGRLRNGRMPYTQIIMDVNPGAPTHWLNQRMNAGLTTRLLSRHEDNPAYYDRDRQAWTPAGERYVQTVLAGLTGVRRARLVFGKWVAAEGMIYTAYDAKTHIQPRFSATNQWGDPPADWPRYLSIDWGYTDPFVCQWWALDGDGRLWMYREIYLTNVETTKHAETIKRIHTQRRDPLPRLVITDPAGADQRATFSRVTGWPTTSAHKDIIPGIEMMQSRLQTAGDGKPRLFILADSRIHPRDSVLADLHKPTSTAEEIDGYVWDERGGRKTGETPIDKDNHGMDAARYVVAEFDLKRSGVSYAPSPFAR